MTNPIANIITGTTNAQSGIVGGTSDLDSPSTTFVDFLLAHIGSADISEAELSAITQDLSDGEISQDSPIFGILGKLTEQFNLEQSGNLSAGNELFIRELAGLFVGLNEQGDINLSGDIVSQLEKINTGDVPAEEFVALLQDTDLFAQLRDAINDERVYGLANTTTDPEDTDEIAAEYAEKVITDRENDSEHIANVEIVLKRLENLLTKIRHRLTNANNPRSEEALQKVADHVSGLIARFESKAEAQSAYIIDGLNVTLNKNFSASANTPAPLAGPVEGFTPTRHAILKAAKGKKGVTSVQSAQATGVSLNTGETASSKKTKGNSFSLSPTGSTGETAWLTPAEGDIGFDPKIDAKAIAADQLQNTIKAAKTSTTQSNARMLLPPSPAAQQVMVHIQKNANNQSRMNIQLNPAELGRVEVRLTISGDGRTTAIVLTDRPETLQLLQKDSVHLEKALQNAGLDIGGQDLSFNLRGDGNTDDFNSRRRFSRHNKNNNLSIDGTQLSGAQIDAAIFDKYSVNYKA